MRLRYAFFPAGGMNTASTRIRLYGIEHRLRESGAHVSYGFDPRADIFYFQKKLDRSLLRKAKVARWLGRKVIYDVDDLGQALGYWTNDADLADMLGLADMVTTCSNAQAAWLKENYPLRRVEVIPNLIDYFPDQVVRISRTSSAMFQIVWFGNFTNFWIFEKHLSTLLSIPDVQINVITDIHALEGKPAAYPQVRFHHWSLPDFITTLQQSDIAFLPHDGNSEDRAKGNNKMITAICWGLPVIATSTLEYSRTAAELGVTEFLVSTPEELIRALERLRAPEHRSGYLDVAQAEAWHRYSPQTIANRFLALSRSLLPTGTPEQCGTQQLPPS